MPDGAHAGPACTAAAAAAASAPSMGPSESAHAGVSSLVTDVSMVKSLRERDDEIVRLREQLRIVNRSPKLSPGVSPSSECDARRLMEENAKLRQNVAQLQGALKSREACASSTASTSVGRTGGASTQGTSCGEEPTVRTTSKSGLGLDQIGSGASLGTCSVATDAALAAALSAVAGSMDAMPDAAATVAAAAEALEGGIVLLKRESQQFCADLVRFKESGGNGGSRSSPFAASPRTTLISRVLALQRQLREQEEEMRSADEIHRGQVARLAQLLEQQRQGELDVKLQAANKAEIGQPAGIHGDASQQTLLAMQRERTILEERLRLIEDEATQRAASVDQLRYEREQWRQERETAAAEQRRRDKTEDALRRQLADVQERLDSSLLQLGEAESRQERQLNQLQQHICREYESEANMRAAAGRQPQQGAATGPRASPTPSPTRGCGRGRGGPVTTVGGRGRRPVAGAPAKRGAGPAAAGTSSPPVAIGGRGSPGIANAATGFPMGCGPMGGGLAPARTPGLMIGANAGSRPGSTGGSVNAPPPMLGASQVADCVPSLHNNGMGGFVSTGHAGAASLAAAAAAATGATVAAPGSIMIAPPVPPLPAIAAAALEAGGDSHIMQGQLFDASYTDSSDDESSTGSSSASDMLCRRRPVASLCAVFGDGPLRRIPGVGWYFRLRIDSVCVGWVGGFAIGVTLTHPLSLSCLPDRAARVPRSWIAGYWGRTFANGQERFCSWRPQSLRLGDEVAFLVGLEGECVVFVNNEEQCRFADPPVPVRAISAGSPNHGHGAGAGGGVEMTPLLDLSATAASVTFLNGAPPPPSVFPGGVSLAVDSADDGLSPPPPSPRVSDPALHIRPPQVGGGATAESSPASRARVGTRPPPVPPLLQLRANNGLSGSMAAQVAHAAAVTNNGHCSVSLAVPSTQQAPPRHIPKLALGSIH